MHILGLRGGRRIFEQARLWLDDVFVKRRRCALGSLAVAVAFLSSPASAATCDAKTFVCGPFNVEDMIVVPRTDWVIASTMEGPQGQPDKLNLINVRTRRFEAVDVSLLSKRLDPNFADCPGALTTGTFRGHGIAIGRAPLRLYAVNHGGRESVEIFEISPNSRSGKPELTWAGCVVAPANANINAVAALPDGGIAITRFRAQKEDVATWSAHLIEGDPTGYLMEWHPKEGWSRVPDSEMSGPNGLLVSDDGREYFISHWGAERLVRLSRGSAVTRRDSVPLGFRPDNIRWGDDGKILAAGQRFTSLPGFITCMMSAATDCSQPYAVARVDPVSLQADNILSVSDPRGFGSASVAIDAGNEIWIGNVRGEGFKRIAKN